MEELLDKLECNLFCCLKFCLKCCKFKFIVVFDEVIDIIMGNSKWLLIKNICRLCFFFLMLGIVV